MKQLTVNYRSHAGIVQAYDRWMASADWSNPNPGGEPFRHHKTIVAHGAGSHADYPSVIRVLGDGADDEARQLAHLLSSLKDHGVITDYAQAALLLHSVREKACRRYLRAFADAGVQYHRGSQPPPVGNIPSLAAILTVERRPSRHFPPGGWWSPPSTRPRGLEWPVVVVGSLDGAGGGGRIGQELAAYVPASPLEPLHCMDEFDRMRQHYVAFSRPQGLLVLTASKSPAARFAPIWDGLPEWSAMDGAALERLFGQRFDPETPSGPPPTPDEIDIHRVKRLVASLAP